MAMLLTMLFPISIFLAQASAMDVDVAITFAVDDSASVDIATAKLQREGHASAISEPRVVEAISSGPCGCIAIAYFEWHTPGRAKLILPWTRICDHEDALIAAQVIRKHGSNGKSCQGFCATSISDAIDTASDLLDAYPGNASSKIVDISSNGTNNEGLPVEVSRARALASGYTINAIAIPAWRYGIRHDLVDYFTQNVVGGPGSFVIEPTRERDYTTALLRKLLVEIGLGAKSNASWLAAK